MDEECNWEEENKGSFFPERRVFIDTPRKTAIASLPLGYFVDFF